MIQYNDFKVLESLVQHTFDGFTNKPVRIGARLRHDAIKSAVRTRIRPILMSTSTTVFGMLPLVVFAGAGAELYRGLAAVIVGGMIVSTFFTLVLIPSLLQFNIKHKTA